ncbi:AB hydrolase-1 domain-containing protein [Mycena indigotica]|uniref:AB hydrolase-1 domain-containing protein n=1 Tax=Mycena indigotica TaxID=2126181 RepID=A0A8H6VVP0_9AGAR|nr:AB hydrolase-1 domain-containing protein [Mycena indigotica]KAF7295607.1 AB hydrolase-1 domain-containing protein [Mycena indigotica]
MLLGLPSQIHCSRTRGCGNGLSHIIAPASSAPNWPFKGTYNILLHSQRGHGQSSVSAAPCTIPLLAHDLAHLISILIPGAAALAFGALYPTLTEGVISCDTGPKTAPGNAEAWQERIALAKTKGIEELASVTVDRWFPSPSKCGQGASPLSSSEQALSCRDDLLKPLSEDGVDLLHSDVKTKVLLVAGELDGGGKVAAGMKGLREKWLEATPAAKVDPPRLPGGSSSDDRPKQRNTGKS